MKDEVEKLILGISNWVDSQHIPSNNGSYRLTPDEAKTALLALLDKAQVEAVRAYKVELLKERVARLEDGETE